MSLPSFKNECNIIGLSLDSYVYNWRTTSMEAEILVRRKRCQCWWLTDLMWAVRDREVKKKTPVVSLSHPHWQNFFIFWEEEYCKESLILDMVSLRSLVDIQMKCQRNKQYINLRCRNEGQTKDLFENHQPTDFFFFFKAWDRRKFSREWSQSEKRKEPRTEAINNTVFAEWSNNKSQGRN